jgi:predicted urease superfamily metal-dependent hydrolase
LKVWEDRFEDGNEMLAKKVDVSTNIVYTIKAMDVGKMVKPHYETTSNLYLCNMLEFSSLESF